MDDLEDIEPALRDRLNELGPETRAVLLHVLKLPDLERVRSIGEFYADPRTRAFSQLLVDLEESPQTRAVVLGYLREREPRGGPERAASRSLWRFLRRLQLLDPRRDHLRQAARARSAAIEPAGHAERPSGAGRTALRRKQSSA